MMEEWKYTELGEICLVKGGKRLPKGHDLIEEQTKHPYIRARDIRNGKINFDQPVYINEETYNKISRYVVNYGDVIITIVGANIGDTAFVTEQFDGANLTENAVKLVSKLGEVDPLFLKYALVPEYMKYYFQTVASGAAQDKLGIYKIKKIKINLPPLPTQRKIASILSAYDDLIENNLKRIKLLEEKAQLTYEEWFVRMKFPGHETTPINKETGLPEGWEKDIINTYFKTSSGGTPSRKKLDRYYKNGSINWVKTKELLGSFIFETEEKITQEAINESSAKIFPKNTILMGMYGGVHGEGRKSTLGQLGIITQESSTNQACCAFIPVGKKPYSLPYLFYFLKERQRFFLNISMGAAQQNISQQLIKSSMYIQPKEELLHMFDSIAQPIFDCTKDLQKQNQLLKESRDILLPRLMTGMIDVEQMSLENLQPTTA